ncbi:hypothetical protein [Sorangium atrum]|uniref:Transposase n=1 Tax=Sorangium atrum TaxID=2995308 RepID=A0ABT5CES8_9BACT|nr:hypothetical protein [Sorangium aterium]MDC0684954.1 hypothetical protein [Sorangium aterium]
MISVEPAGTDERQGSGSESTRAPGSEDRPKPAMERIFAEEIARV